MTHLSAQSAPSLGFGPQPEQSQSEQSQPDQTSRRLGILALGLAGLTLFLMALGSATRVWNAGLSCPDWPFCYGSLLPREQMNWQVFLEWFHRWVATTVGILVLGQMTLAWLWRKSLPVWAPWGAALAVALVIGQGILGGLTVTELLRFDIVTAHLGTGLLFFSTLLGLGLLLLMTEVKLDPVPVVWKPLPWVGVGAVALVYGQSLLGALVATQWALHQCLAQVERSCWVMNSHIVGVIPATVATLLVVGSTWMLKKSLPKPLKACGHLAATCLVAQVTLGITTYKMHLQLEALTVAHQAVGALLLGSLVAFTTLAFGYQRFSPAGAKSPALNTESSTESNQGLALDPQQT